MASKQSCGSTAVSLEMADDFRSIKGIGPALAGRLRDAGIRTYDELASLSPAKLAARVIGLSTEQIARQDWIGQARKLASKKAQSKTHKKVTVAPTIRRRYENFTIEFLLDEKNETCRTRVVHVQSGDVDIWVGWKVEKLNDFLTRHTGLHIRQAKSALQKTEVARRKTVRGANRASMDTPMRTPSLLPVFSAITELAPPSTEIAQPTSQSSVIVNLAGTLQLRDSKVVLMDSNIPIFSLRQGQPYLLRLTLDLSDVVAPNGAPLIYKATVIFRQLGGPRQPMSEASSTLKLSDSATLDIAGISLLPGIYRLETFVRLTSDEAAPGLTAFLKGDFLQVY